MSINATDLLNASHDANPIPFIYNAQRVTILRKDIDNLRVTVERLTGKTLAAISLAEITKAINEYIDSLNTSTSEGITTENNTNT